MAESINFRFALIFMYQNGDLFHTLVAKNAFFVTVEITTKRKFVLSVICFVGGDRRESWHFSLGRETVSYIHLLHVTGVATVL